MIDKNILIVDDDDNMREAMKETVLRLGVSVDTAENGRTGFEKATKKVYDLIISDMRMPEIDGLSMFEMLKATGIKTPVCFVTAYGSVTGAVEALKIGAYDYILKPFSPEVIEELIRRTFELAGSQNSAAGNVPLEDNSKKGTVYKSAYMEHIFSLAKDVAESEATVLITGESGTGKEVLARFIHENSGHAKGPFVAVNCAAIPENLIESELFGYEKGAFTGAVNKKIGKFEAADGGTILLDEIGEIPLHLQAKLLRVLQEREVERLGALKPSKINTRVLATTNRNLKVMSEEGSFREDLYYRLNVISMELPPLRDRKEDVADLSLFFIKKYSEINKKPVKPLSDDALKTLQSYEWPGNVRELEHTIERAVVLSKTTEITSKDLFLHGITIAGFKSNPKEDIKDIIKEEKEEKDAKEAKYSAEEHKVDNAVGRTIADVEQELILKTLQDVSGNRTKAAEILGITVRTLRNKLNEYRDAGIDVEEYLK
ncbi:sigma-54-dependent transcriptional regulator [Mucispirillum schaedleri]|uniref:sigma-54-dependent transcriptional regulator n=1 Tax=Mucispirillum schaedleri TaxID=248039 RepID=UPI001F58B162|nr:sigma-54 dependent transcriptional regulator [Mucispirillum schaedleri]